MVGNGREMVTMERCRCGEWCIVMVMMTFSFLMCVWYSRVDEDLFIHNVCMVCEINITKE